MKAVDALGDLRRRRSADAALGRAEDHARAAQAQLVALLQALAPAHALAVDERAVARQAVVGHRPGVADALELGVHARDAVVPVQRQVDALAAPDAQPVAVGGQPHEVLGLRAVAQEQERLALALGEDALLHLDRRGRVRVQRRAGRTGHCSTDATARGGAQARALACGSRRVIVTAASSAARAGPAVDALDRRHVGVARGRGRS